MEPASFDYFAPITIRETLELLTRHGDDAKLLAGGQSLLPTMKLRLAQPRYLIDLGQVGDLPSGVSIDGNDLVIGAFTLHADVATSDVVRQRLPGLADAAERIGDVQVRNRGTMGGSCAHADPGADFPVILTALNATLVAVSPRRQRTMPVDNFFVDFYTTALEVDEVLTEIRVPLPPASAATAYAKLGNPASGYVVVSAGALIVRGPSGECASARVAVGGIQATPFRARAVEESLAGQPLTPEAIANAASRAVEGADPYGDQYASEEYKRQLATVYVRRALQAAAEREGARP
jgi:aerobic carbon-monoxide dehydrogenase medium subunit